MPSQKVELLLLMAFLAGGGAGGSVLGLFCFMAIQAVRHGIFLFHGAGGDGLLDGAGFLGEQFMAGITILAQFFLVNLVGEGHVAE